MKVEAYGKVKQEVGRFQEGPRNTLQLLPREKGHSINGLLKKHGFQHGERIKLTIQTIPKKEYLKNVYGKE